MAREDSTVEEEKQTDGGKPDLGCAWYMARLNKEKRESLREPRIQSPTAQWRLIPVADTYPPSANLKHLRFTRLGEEEE